MIDFPSPLVLDILNVQTHNCNHNIGLNRISSKEVISLWPGERIGEAIASDKFFVSNTGILVNDISKLYNPTFLQIDIEVRGTER